MKNITGAIWIGLLMISGGSIAACAQLSAEQLTTNALSESWGVRHSPTSQGRILWIDGANTVVFFNGSTTNAVQPQGGLLPVTDTVFALGSGGVPGQTIAVWRRGDDTGWVSINGGPPVAVSATNPVNAAQPMNAEGVAIADGSVFLLLQAAIGGGKFAGNVFHVDPTTGAAVALTSATNVLGALGVRLRTSAGQAAWSFNDDSVTNDNPVLKLHFFDGATVRIVDSGIVGDPHLCQGRIVYLKTIAGEDQVFLYDSTTPNPSPVQLTTDTVGTKAAPRTDGWHVAWLQADAGGTRNDIVLRGGVPLTAENTFLPFALGEFREQPFQLQRGQLLWKDATGRLLQSTANGITPVNIFPATNFGGSTCCLPFLADGVVAWIGRSSDGGTDSEVFRFAGIPPPDSAQPLPPLVVTVTPGTNQVTLGWDQIIGATSYRIYLAPQAIVTKENYQTLLGGRKISGVSSPFTVTGLTNRTYFFRITAVANGVEGPGSSLAAATLWSPAAGLPVTNFRAVAAGRTNGSAAYVAGGNAVFKTPDGGASWTGLSGGIAAQDIRALAVDGPRVYAATRDGDLWRSTNAGTNWTAVADGSDIGEQKKTLVLDPLDPTILFAGNFQLPGMIEPDDSFVIKSVDAGNNWFHLPESASPFGAEIRAYVIALNPQDPKTVYAGGSGTPNLVRSTDGGTNWTDVSPGFGYVYALAVDPVETNTVYTGSVKFTQDSNGILKTTNGGTSWSTQNFGLPSPLPRVNALLADPSQPQVVHAGTDLGYFFTLDGGEHWQSGNGGLTTPVTPSINALAMTESRQLLAATDAGLFVLDLSKINFGPPQLSLVRSNNTVVLSWLTATADFALETTNSLASATSWSPVMVTPAATNDQRSVILTVQPGSQFFRLRWP